MIVINIVVNCCLFTFSQKKTDSWARLLMKWADKFIIKESLKRCFLKIRRILHFKFKLTKMPQQTMANTITAYSNVLFLHSNADSYQEFIWWFVIWEIDYWNLLALQLCWNLNDFETWTDNKLWISTGRYVCAFCNFQADKNKTPPVNQANCNFLWAD